MRRAASALAGLERVGVGLLVDRLAQQAPRLQLRHGREQDDQLARRLGVPALAGALAEGAGHDLEERQLEQVDLVAQDQRQEQVERALEEVELHGLLEGVGRGHRVGPA